MTIKRKKKKKLVNDLAHNLFTFIWVWTMCSFVRLIAREFRTIEEQAWFDYTELVGVFNLPPRFPIFFLRILRIIRNEETLSRLTQKLEEKRKSFEFPCLLSSITTISQLAIVYFKNEIIDVIKMIRIFPYSTINISFI